MVGRSYAFAFAFLLACSGGESGNGDGAVDAPLGGDSAVDAPSVDANTCTPGTVTCDLFNADVEIRSESPLASVVVTAGACRVVPGCLMDARTTKSCTRVFAGGIPGVVGADGPGGRTCELTVTALDGRSTSVQAPLSEGSPHWVCCEQGPLQVVPRSFGTGVIEVTFDVAADAGASDGRSGG
jgi:hypothetical protein